MKMSEDTQMKDPVTREEWQEVMDAATGAMSLRSARLYGLVQGGPVVDVRRCEELLRRGRDLGHAARPDAIERFMIGLLQDEQSSKR